MNSRTLIASTLLLAGLVRADVPAFSFDRYQIILDRKPFGDLPAPVVTPPPGPPPESFTKFYRISSIVQEDDGTVHVGIIDNRGNKSIILKVGESQDGLSVLEASYEKETATLKFGSEEQVLSLKTGTTPVIVPGQPMPMAGAPQITATPPDPNDQSRLSYADRRRQRMLQQQEPTPATPAPKYTGEALQKHLQEYQMEVIRQGLPPLPIPLTQDQDNQLVKEGILPAQK